MKGGRFLYPAIALATMLIAGLVASLWFLLASVDRASEADRILACVTEVGHRSPTEDARADFKRGERRFLLLTHNGIDITLSAEGLCRIDSWKDLRSPPFAGPKFEGLFSVKGNHCCDRDPPVTACGAAISSYYRAYNREMARLSPQSVKAYCTDGKATRHP